MSMITLELIARRNNKPTIWEMGGKKIKRCPFCGCVGVHLVEDEGAHWCSCDECGVEGPYGLSRIHAIHKWQGRAT